MKTVTVTEQFLNDAEAVLAKYKLLQKVHSETIAALKALEECVSGMDQSTLDPDFDDALTRARIVILKQE